MERHEMCSPELLGAALDNISPLPKEKLLAAANGIDLIDENIPEHPSRTAGAAYERHCFHAILGRPGITLILGPNLVNYYFDRKPTKTLSRPDAMEFNISESGLSLRNLYEFKSNIANKRVIHKLDGFSAFIDFLSANPAYLGQMIKKSLSNVITISDRLLIPAKDLINVHFVVNKKGKNKKSTYNLFIHGL